MATDRSDRDTSRPPRWWREPTVHFFALAGLALLGHRLAFGAPRTIELTAALRADLLRRYGDQLNRPPTTAEAEAFIAAWKTDEALYREALNEGIDRDDPAVRQLLVAKMKERLVLRARTKEPSEADLKRYLEEHRRDFEVPLRYEHDYVTLAKSQPAIERERALAALRSGSTPESLGLRHTAANVVSERIAQELGAAAAAAIPRLELGRWEAIEASDSWLLVRLNRVEGGLPPPDQLREQLMAAWKAERRARDLVDASRGVVESYRFEEPAR
jgi:PPIC-type PPIASE domain